MIHNQIVEHITNSFKDIMEKYNLSIEKNEELVLFNKRYKLKFICQNLDGIDLVFENDSRVIPLDFIFNKYIRGSVSLLTDKEKESSKSSYYLIDRYKILLEEEGNFLLEDNKVEIQKFIDWKIKNKQKIINDLFSKFRNNLK